jgi:hypothetical protein
VLDELEPAASEESGFRPVIEYYHYPLAAALLVVLAWAFASVFTAVRVPPFAELSDA